MPSEGALLLCYDSSSYFCRTSSSSTAGKEARIQAGAVTAVGWSALLVVISVASDNRDSHPVVESPHYQSQMNFVAALFPFYPYLDTECSGFAVIEG